MKIPTNPTEVGKAHPAVTSERQATLVSHLQSTPDANGQAVVDEIVKQGGADGAFVAALMGRSVPGRTDSPRDKKLGGHSTK